MLYNDKHFMRLALEEANKAYDKGEVPIGAVIAHGETLIAKGHNLTETLCDVTAHAEMQAITSAAQFLGGKYLRGCTLYVTLEPCMMCAGALYWTQIDRVVFAARDKKRGFAILGGSLHPKTSISTGILKRECASIIEQFFKEKR